MSVVTNILLCAAIDDSGVHWLNSWLVLEQGDACRLKPLHPYATGSKAMEADVFGVAVNYLNVDSFVAAFLHTPWDRPESAQLLIKREDDDVFKMYEAVP